MGKALHYANALGSPDTEAVTKAAAGAAALYIASERDNENNGVSRLVVAMFEGSTTAPTINALRDWGGIFFVGIEGDGIIYG
ncbi:MAG TPA: hypothetical protein VJV79_20200 [Polyangiaceae bacterium]|nr:hypothetical protein [Polyangiaceae bacterium]